MALPASKRVLWTAISRQRAGDRIDETTCLVCRNITVAGCPRGRARGGWLCHWQRPLARRPRFAIPAHPHHSGGVGGFRSGLYGWLGMVRCDRPWQSRLGGRLLHSIPIPESTRGVTRLRRPDRGPGCHVRDCHLLEQLLPQSVVLQPTQQLVQPPDPAQAAIAADPPAGASSTSAQAASTRHSPPSPETASQQSAKTTAKTTAAAAGEPSAAGSATTTRDYKARQWLGKTMACTA